MNFYSWYGQVVGLYKYHSWDKIQDLTYDLLQAIYPKLEGWREEVANRVETADQFDFHEFIGWFECTLKGLFEPDVTEMVGICLAIEVILKKGFK